MTGVHLRWHTANKFKKLSKKQKRGGKLKVVKTVAAPLVRQIKGKNVKRKPLWLQSKKNYRRNSRVYNRRNKKRQSQMMLQERTLCPYFLVPMRIENQLQNH